MKFSLEIAGVQHVAAIIALYNEVASEGSFLIFDQMPIPLYKYEAIFKNRKITDHCTIIAKNESEEIIGYIELMRLSGAKRKHVCTFTLLVKKEYRGMGIGQKLLERGIQWAKENGFIKIAISTMSTNHTAIALYRKNGFTEVGRYHKQFITEEYIADEVMMELFLNGTD